MLAFSENFLSRQGTNKGSDKETEYEMTMVKQQAFIFRIAGVHSSLERRVKTYAAGLQLGQVLKRTTFFCSLFATFEC